MPEEGPASLWMALCVRFSVAIPGSEALDLLDVLAVSRDTVVAIEIFLPGSEVVLTVDGKYSLMVSS